MQSFSIRRSISAVLVALACSTTTVELCAPPSDAAAAHVKNQPKHVADKLARKAQQVATQMDSVGWCFAGVKQALQSVGVALYGAAAWMAAPQLKQDSRFHVVSKNACLQKGDIMVHGRSPAHPYGHIAVYLGNGKEASDHVQKVVLGGRYGKTEIFRPGSAGATSVIAQASSNTKRGSQARLTSKGKRIVGARASLIASGTKTGAPSHPTAEKPAAPDAATIAAAETEAKKFAYLYSQGAVSRNEAEQRLAEAKALRAQAPAPSQQKIATAKSESGV